MTGSELGPVQKAIFARLRGDGILASLLGDADLIFFGAAPQGTPGPFVIVNHQSGIDRTVIGAVRIVSRPLYLVKAVTQEDGYDTADDIFGRVDTLLMGYKTTEGSLNISSEGRQGQVVNYEILQGNRWNYVGGLYRFFVS